MTMIIYGLGIGIIAILLIVWWASRADSPFDEWFNFEEENKSTSNFKGGGVSGSW